MVLNILLSYIIPEIIYDQHFVYMKEMLYEVWCLKSNEDMILTLAGQF